MDIAAAPPDPVFDPGRRLGDGFGRRFEYLRLSLTDVCNFRCTYCLPQGYRKNGASSALSREEFVRAVRGFAALGLWKVRLTGGEPSLHPEFEAIARDVAAVDGIRRVAMTTNGYRLAANARRWRDCGISAVNVSIDSLDPRRFHAITGHDRLEEVLAGVEAARDAGFEAVKINAVLMRGVNDDELAAMIDFVASRAVSLRFIELMRTNDNQAFFARHHLSGEVIARQLEGRGWVRVAKSSGAGPALEYAHPESLGRIGIIAPYSDGFCTTCNRLRLSSSGRLHLCLFGEQGHDLTELLRSDDQLEELVAMIRALTATKEVAHRLHEANSGATPHLASIGG